MNYYSLVPKVNSFLRAYGSNDLSSIIDPIDLDELKNNGPEESSNYILVLQTSESSSKAFYGGYTGRALNHRLSEHQNNFKEKGYELLGYLHLGPFSDSLPLAHESHQG